MHVSRWAPGVVFFVVLCFVATCRLPGDDSRPDPQASQKSAAIEVRHGPPVRLSQQAAQGTTVYQSATPSSSYGQPQQGTGNQPKAAPSDATIRIQAQPAPVGVSALPASSSVPQSRPQENVQPLPQASSAFVPTDTGSQGKVDGNPFKIIRQVSFPRNTQLFEFSNGLAVIVQERPKTELATVRVYIRNTGSMNEGTLSGSGVSHLVEHLVAQGATRQRNQNEVAATINRLGGAHNAWTSRELTSYYIDCSASDTTEAIGLLADLVNNAVFDKSRFDSEKSVIRQENLDGLNNREQVADDLLMHIAYSVHPCRYPIDGYPDLFNSLTFENVKEFYATRYVPNNQIVVVVGDVSTSNVLTEITRAWKAIPRGPEYLQAAPTEPIQVSPRLALREMPGKTCLTVFAWPGTTVNDPDAYALDVLATVLSEGKTSRLVERLKHKSQLAIDIHASHDTQQSIAGRFVVTAEVTPENLEKLQTEVLDELYRLREFPVTSAELNRARKQTQAAFVFVEESGQNVADMLALNYIATGDPNYRDVYLAGIQQVSIEDIRRVAKKHITPESLSKVLVTPSGMLPRQIENEKGRIDQDVQAVAFPGSKLRLLTKMSNGVPMVNIQFSLLAGSLVETDATAGSSAVLAEMLDKGSQKYSQAEVANYFDSIGSHLVFSAGHNTIRAEATVLKDDLNEALAVMFDAFFNPLLSEDAFQKAQRTVLDRIESRSGNPMLEIADLFCQSLPNATSYHLLVNGTTESVKNLKLDSLRQFHQKYFHPDNMVVSIFGDFDTTKVATELNSLLQLKQFTGKAPSISFERTNELIQSISEHKKTQRSVALGIVAWPTVSVHSQKEIATLTVLQTLLGGYGYPDGKLFNELRQQKLVYCFFIEQVLGPVPGYMLATFETAPERIQNVLETIDRQFADVQQGKLTDDELQAAKKRIMAYHAIEHTTLSQKAMQCSLDELYGLGFANDLSFNQRIQDVTLDDVIAAARRFIRQKVIVTTSPDEKATR